MNKTNTTQTDAPTYQETDYPRDILITEEGYELLGELQDYPGSPFADTTNKDLYAFAVAYAAHEGLDVDGIETGNRSIGQRDTLSADQANVLKAVAVMEELDAGVLVDGKRIATIYQQYAIAGLRELKVFLVDADDADAELLSKVQTAFDRAGG